MHDNKIKFILCYQKNYTKFKYWEATMNNISNQKLNININNTKNTYLTNSSSISTDNIQTQSTDTIKLSEKNENIINTKKAYDAFKDTCSDFGCIKTSNNCSADMSLYYNTALSIMETRGISISSFISDSQNNTSYLSFIDTVKDFAKDLNTTGPKYLPDSFLDFCDSYKEKLTQYGCK